jgi:nucleoid-associated protein YgaU
MLSELNVEYKLFRPNGSVLRAVAKAKFIEFIEKEELAAIQNNKSPDLTHIRMVQEGDTLPLMTYRIYGDSKYYLHVAKVNGLANFRKLSPGQQIYFPPLQKQS